jgi:hypothetical protein
MRERQQLYGDAAPLGEGRPAGGEIGLDFFRNA